MPNPAPRSNPKGPAHAKIAIVVDFPTADDIWKGSPLSGRMGEWFQRLLLDTGIIPSACYITSAMKTRPRQDNPDLYYTSKKTTAQKQGNTQALGEAWVSPEIPSEIQALHEELAAVSPTVILALGDYAMFALTGIYGSVDTWRGSHLDWTHNPSITVIPTYTPAQIMRQWEVKGFCQRDLQRVRDIAREPGYYAYPTYSFLPSPTFTQAKDTLLSLLAIPLSGKRLPLACDIETIARHISCIGVAWSCREALCIPFLTLDGHYWTEEEEIELMFLLRSLLTHPLTEVFGQNFNYDNQYFAKYLGFLPNLSFDTMIAQHVLFPGIPKALDFLSSMYCHWHRYWKDEINDYNKLPENMEQYWTYNCKDVVVTFECALVLKELLAHLNRTPQYDFMFRVSKAALRTMLKGIRVEQKARSETSLYLMQAIAEYDTLIQDIVGFPLSVTSPKQMAAFFYGDLHLPIQTDRKTKQPTLGTKAMAVLCQKEPLIRPLVSLIDMRRSAGVFLSTFCQMPLDTDGRMRCSFNVCGTETMRFSSSKNAFGSGGNLQNIPRNVEED